jgi:hypothetical protein
MSLQRLLLAGVTACLVCAFGAPTYAAGTAATAKKGSDDSATEVKLVPGWSGGTPSGVLEYPQGFDLTGADNQYFFGSYQQLGPRGFFGDYGIDRNPPGLFANLNGWVGNPRTQATSVTTVTNGSTPDIANDLVSGTGASVSSVLLNITPAYGNDWVHLKARYTINAYQTSAFPGAATPIALPQLTLWQAKVSTPIADIALGKYIFQRGCSLQFSSNRTAEFLILEKSYEVPNILGRLVCAGILPPRVMSWFNPEFWPRYSQAHQNEKTTKDLGEPEYQLYGGDSISKKSIFTLMDERRRQVREDELKTKVEEANKKVEEANKKVEEAGHFNADKLTRALAELKAANAEQKAAMAEQTAYEQEQKAEEEREKKWPSDSDPYAWNYLTPGRVRVGFGFIGWEVPNPYPCGAELLTPYIVAPLTAPFTTTLYNRNDFTLNAMNNLIGSITYTSSDMEFGVGCLRSSFHQGPEIQPWFQPPPPPPPVPLSRSTPTFERYVTEGWAYLIYNNGRFFFKTELDWFNRIFRFQGSQDGKFFGQDEYDDKSGRSRFAPRYWESWRYMAEAGAHCGPFAGRIFYSFMPGPDRRHGIYIDRQPFVLEFPQQALGLFDPYSSLLSFRFGSGMNAPGHISDASVFAFKLDYLLASNLLIEGSFLKAIRNSHGYPMGFIRPDTTTPNNFGRVVYGEPPGSRYEAPAPSIPDRDLGWEAMAGMVWELMDGWAIKAQMAYWQPGRWFNYACIDKGVLNWNAPVTPPDPPNLGINPDRKIDPVLGWEIYIGARY